MDGYEIRLRNLEFLFVDTGTSRKELASLLGIDTGQVNHWFMSRDTKGYRNIGTRKAREIEKAFEKPTGWLDSPQWPQSASSLGEPRATYTRDVPIIGNVIATPDTDGYFDDMGFPPGAGEAYVPWGTRDKNAYAVRVKSDSMAPRYKPNEILIVEPNTSLAPGEDVIVRTKDGRKMVKEFLYQRAGEVTLGSINQKHPQITIAMDLIESIEVVAGSVRRGVEK